MFNNTNFTKIKAKGSVVFKAGHYCTFGKENSLDNNDEELNNTV